MTATDDHGVLGTEEDVIGQRVIAFLIDYVLSLIVAIGITLGLAVAGALASRAAFVLTAFVILFLYHAVPEGLWGQTPGKRLLGIVVVGTDGSACGIKRALVRNLLRVVDGIGNYAVGLVVMLLTGRRQRVGDLVADTVVVRARRR